jgi:hypothetical protein
MPHPIAVTTNGSLWFDGGFQARAPVSKAPADIGGVELERVAGGYEREGAVCFIGGEPGLDFREETPPSRTLVARPSVKREDGVGQHRNLEALLGLNATPAPYLEKLGG